MSLDYLNNVWSIKIRTTHNLSLWLYEYFWIILLYGHLVYFILKVLAWEICNMKWEFAKKVIIKPQRQFMYGLNFYVSDVRKNHTKRIKIFLTLIMAFNPRCVWGAPNFSIMTLSSSKLNLPVSLTLNLKKNN